MKLSAPPMSIPEAAVVLGWPTDHEARRLRRYLLAAHARCGCRLLARRGGEGAAGARYTVTVAHLRRYCPELFDRATEIGLAVSREIQQMRADLTDVDDSLRVRVAHLEERNRQLSKEVAALRSANRSSSVKFGLAA